jgi:hypothetical protein
LNLNFHAEQAKPLSYCTCSFFYRSRAVIIVYFIFPENIFLNTHYSYVYNKFVDCNLKMSHRKHV